MATVSRSGPARLLAIALLAATSTTAAALAAHGSEGEGQSEGWSVYRELVGECETATSLEALLPYLPQWRHKAYEAANEADRKATLDRICGATRDLEEIALVSQTTTDKDSELQLKALWNDFPMNGKITLVREDESLKVENWSWATGQ